jgi:hypothetical protein
MSPRKDIGRLPLPDFDMTAVPPVGENYVLPPGDYPLTLDELERSLLVTGPSDGRFPDWNRDRRLWLVGNLRILVGQLRQAGIMEIFIAGSFVESKGAPDDIDGYYMVDAVRLPAIRARLDQANPLLFRVRDQSTWVDIPAKATRRPEIYQRYHIELFWDLQQVPYFAPLFRKTRSGRPKGIIRII